MNVLWILKDKELAKIKYDFLMIELDPNILHFKNIGNGRALYKILIES